MAIRKVINILVNSTNAKKNINQLNKELKSTGDLNTKVTQSTNNMSKSFSVANVASKGLAGGLRLVGTAFKAMGIGLLVSLLAMLTTALSKNERVVKLLGQAMDWVTDVVNGVVEVVAEFIEKIKGSGDEMGAFQKIVKGVWQTIQGYFKTYTGTIIVSVMYMVEKVATALNKIGIVSDNALEGIIDFKEKGIDRVTEGMNDMKEGANLTVEGFKEVGSAVKESTANFNNHRLASKELREETERLKQANEDLKIAIDVLRDNYETLYTNLNIHLKRITKSMESYLKISNDEKLSLDERIDATRDYIKASNEQLDVRRRIAQERVKEAQTLYNMERSVSNYNKLLERQGELEILNLEINDERASIEEKLNKIYSDREGIIDDIIKKSQDDKSDIEKLEDEFNKRKELLENQATSEIENDIQLKEALLENERWFNDQKTKIELEEKEKLDEILEEIRLEQIEDEQERYELEQEKKMERVLFELEQLKANEEQIAEVKEFYANRISDHKAMLDEQERKREEIKNKAAVALVIGAVKATLDALDAGSDAKKGIAVSEALWNTFLGITKALDMGFPASIPGIAFASATGFGAVTNILNTKSSSSSAGSASAASGRGGSGGTSPNFNVVSENKDSIMDEIDAKMSDQPTKAYVVGSEVSTQQELDRNRVKRGRII